MLPYDKPSPLFDLPLELREQIYRNVLVVHNHGLEILRTCREIYTEAHKLLYQRPILFDSQDCFYAWLDQTKPHYLVYVTEISLAIKDIDLRTLLKSDPQVIQQGTAPRLLTWEVYKVELHKLQQALKKLSKVSAISFRALSIQQSHFYQKFIDEILDMIGSVYPNLLVIKLEGNFCNRDLGFLTKITSLKSFSFDGFSSTLPRDAAKIFAHLEHLTSLSLISQHALLKPDAQTYSIFPTPLKSITGDVVNTMDRLKSFSVIEHVSRPSPTIFFTAELFDSLHGNAKLRSLSISLSYTPDPEFVSSLESFIQQSAIEKLELDWPKLDSLVLKAHNLLTNTVRDFWVRARSTHDAFDILCSAADRREDGGLQNLRRLVLMRTTNNYWLVATSNEDRKDSGADDTCSTRSDDGFAPSNQTDAQIALLKRRLRYLGIHVAFCTDEP